MSDSPPVAADSLYQFSIFLGFGSYGVALLTQDGEIITEASTDGVNYTPVDISVGGEFIGQYFRYDFDLSNPAFVQLWETPWPDNQAVIDAIEANAESGTATPLNDYFHYGVTNAAGTTDTTLTFQLNDIVFANQNGQLFSNAQPIAAGASILVEGLTVHEGVASWETTDADKHMTVVVSLRDMAHAGGTSGVTSDGTLAIDPTKVGAAAGTGETVVLDNTSALHTLTISGSVAQINAELAGLVYTAGTGPISDDSLIIEATTATQTTAAVFLGTLDTAACYCPGTLIRTPDGATAVEALAIGDLVATLHGGARTVKWIGRRSYAGRFIAGRVLLLPVCLRRDAIAAGVPSRDLWVSAGHAIYLDGGLVPAWRLVNGVSIIQPPTVDRVTYLHVELDEHEVIFAEDCAAESFLDDGCRGQFANAAEFHALYPDAAPHAVLPCTPRVEDGFALHAIQRRLERRAGIQRPTAAPGPLRGFVDHAGSALVAGWAQDAAQPEEPVCLDILLDGQRVARVLANGFRADLRAAGIGSGRHGFSLALPSGARGVVTVRRSADHAALALTDAARAAAA